MPLTQNCDIFGAVHEGAFNNVVLRLQQQRPSIFNYGTLSFVEEPKFLCNQRLIEQVDPNVALFNNPVVKEQPLLRVPGYNGPYGLEYCFQLAELSLDLHPGNVHALPPELSPPLSPQRFSLQGKVCVGLNCPGSEILRRISPKGQGILDRPDRPDDRKDVPVVSPSPGQAIPFEPKRTPCYCLELYSIFHVKRSGSGPTQVLSLGLDNLELVDVGPERLESMLECFLRTTLILGILPKIRVAVRSLVFDLGGLLTVSPTPTSPTLPFNPAVEDDQIKVFISLTA